jgi:hypothetical protein
VWGGGGVSSGSKPGHGREARYDVAYYGACCAVCCAMGCGLWVGFFNAIVGEFGKACPPEEAT